MNEFINIPTPIPEQYEQLKASAFNLKNVAIGKAINYIPEKYQDATEKLMNPPTVQDLIEEYLLEKYPDAPTPIDGQLKSVPIVQDNRMPTVSGATLSGTPLYSNLEITGRNYTGFDGVVRGYRDMRFETVIITCQQQKNIIETQIQGSDDGAVIEYSSLNNYVVTINLIIVGNQNGVYPQTAVEELIKALTAPVSLKVSSWYLLMMDIQELVVTSYDINQIAGGISQQPITIQAKSSKLPTLVIQ